MYREMLLGLRLGLKNVSEPHLAACALPEVSSCPSRGIAAEPQRLSAVLVLSLVAQQGAAIRAN